MLGALVAEVGVAMVFAWVGSRVCGVLERALKFAAVVGSAMVAASSLVAVVRSSSSEVRDSPEENIVTG